MVSVLGIVVSATASSLWITAGVAIAVTTFMTFLAAAGVTGTRNAATVGKIMQANLDNHAQLLEEHDRLLGEILERLTRLEQRE